MAEISVGAAVGEGFTLIRTKPLTVLAWGLIEVLFRVATLALIGPMLVTVFATAFHQAQTGGAGPSPAAMMQTMPQLQSLNSLLNLVGVVMGAVFSCAIFRAVLHPEQGRFAYLRIGGTELILALLTLGIAVGIVLGVLMAAVVIGLVVGLLVVLHATIVAVIVGVVAGIAAFVAIVYVALRLSFIGPMMVDQGKFELTDAWALTRGRTASLFAIALVVFLILIAIELVVGLILFAAGLGVLASAAGGLTQLPTFFQQPPEVLFAKLAPFLVILAVVGVPLSGCVLTIIGAPWARAYRDLQPQRDVAETFA